MEKGTPETIEVFKSSYNEKSKQFFVSEDVVRINADSYFKTDKTTLSIINSKDNLQTQKRTSKYRKAEEYKFSNEISLFYRVYPGRKNKYAGVAYYKEIKDANLKTWGSKVSDDIEKGLKADTKDEVIFALENTVFDKKLYTIIRDDVWKKYVTKKKLVTLKTI